MGCKHDPVLAPPGEVWILAAVKPRLIVSWDSPILRSLKTTSLLEANEFLRERHLRDRWQHLNP